VPSVRSSWRPVIDANGIQKRSVAHLNPVGIEIAKNGVGMSNRSCPVTIVQVLLARHSVDRPGGCRRSCPSVPPPLRRRLEPQDLVLHISRSRPVPLNPGRFQPAPPPQKIKRVSACTQRGTATRDELSKELPPASTSVSSSDTTAARTTSGSPTGPTADVCCCRS